MEEEKKPRSSKDRKERNNHANDVRLRLMEMDGAKLTFDEAALHLIAQEALKRKTGARGLRAVLEGIMQNVMYEIPSIDGVSSCRVTKDVVLSKKDPVLTIEKRKQKRIMSSKEVSA